MDAHRAIAEFCASPILDSGRDTCHMHILGLSLREVFTLLFIAMGPVRVTLTYLPIARALSPQVQRKLAWRTVVTGFLVALVLILGGAGMVSNLHLSLYVLMLAAGMSYVILAVPMLLPRSSTSLPLPQMEDPLRLALSPLAVPSMITPLGVAVLFSEAAFVANPATTLIFGALVVAILALNFGCMLLSTRLTRYLTRPVLDVLQTVFGFVTLAFGIRLILGALAHLGIILVRGLS